MLDAMLFEVEGVLAETHGARREAAIAALAREGIEVTAVAYDAEAQGLPVRGSIEALLAARGVAHDDTMIDLIARAADNEFGERLSRGLLLTEGASRFIDAAAGRVRLGIVTRASRRETEMILTLSGVADAFECVRCDEDAFPPKPANAPYLGALERLSRRRPVHPRRVLAFEDGAAGIRAAGTANVRCAAVGAIAAHIAMDADLLIDSLAEQTVASLEALLATEGARRE